MDRIDKDEGAPETDLQKRTDYAVGYGKPPMEMRFKSGQSGNRQGRKGGSKNHKTIVKEVANETHRVTENGKWRQRSTLELMLLAFRNRAADGDVRAFRAYRKFLAKYEPQEAGSELGYLVVPAPMTEEEARAEGEKANIEADARHARYLEEKRLREMNG
jgi:hypothetical protein